MIMDSIVSSSPPPHLSSDGVSQFQFGISLILSRWSTLTLAVENEFAGRDSSQKQNQLEKEILYFFKIAKEPLYIDDLEDRIDEFMLTLNTEIDDGSIEEIAEKLMIMHEECLHGNYQSVQMLKDNPPPGVVKHIRQEGNNDDDDESAEEDESSGMAVDAPNSHSNTMNSNEEMMVDEPRPKVEVETDGWTIVPPRRNRGRKN